MRKVPESGTVAVQTNISAAKTTATIMNARTREAEKTAWANGKAIAALNNSCAIAEVCNPDSDDPSMRAISRENSHGTISPALIEEMAAPNNNRVDRVSFGGSTSKESRTVTDVPVVDFLVVDFPVGSVMVEPR
jgi:hypothetical protein